MTTNAAPEAIDFADIKAAASRIAAHALVTPVLQSRSLDTLVGAELLCKCENLQRVGAFKFRGACNAVWSLPAAQAARGVVTHSSGNHGQATACAAAMLGMLTLSSRTPRPVRMRTPSGSPLLCRLSSRH